MTKCWDGERTNLGTREGNCAEWRTREYGKERVNIEEMEIQCEEEC